MHIVHLPDLKKHNTKICTVWLDKSHKSYIEDLAHITNCNQRDVMFHIIKHFMETYPLKPLKDIYYE